MFAVEGDNDYYAKWIVSSSSGTCPIVVEVPLDMPEICWKYVGCGLEKPQELGGYSRTACITAQNPNTWGSRNRPALGEMILGLLLLSPLLLVGGATIILVPIALAVLAWLAVFIVKCFEDPFDYNEDASESTGTATGLCGHSVHHGLYWSLISSPLCSTNAIHRI
jgi:hypothetical protein